MTATLRLLNDKLGALTAAFEAGSLGDLSGLSAEEIAARIEAFLSAPRG